MISLLVGFLAACLDVELIVMNPAGGQRGEADVGGVGAERLDLPVARIRPGTDDSSQGGAQQIAVMPVGPADGERQRDATGVHQKTALAPIFSLYRWSWVPRILAPAVLCSWPHPRSANAKRCPPFRRTRPGRPSISSGKSLPAAAAANHIDNRRKNLPRWHRLASRSGFALVLAATRPLSRWDQPLKLAPQRVRRCPRLDLCHQIGRAS